MLTYTIIWPSAVLYVMLAESLKWTDGWGKTEWARRPEAFRIESQSRKRTESSNARSRFFPFSAQFLCRFSSFLHLRQKGCVIGLKSRIYCAPLPWIIGNLKFDHKIEISFSCNKLIRRNLTFSDWHCLGGIIRWEDYLIIHDMKLNYSMRTVSIVYIY